MKIPEHIGIIPDGNRRWAVSHGMKKQEGYTYGLMPGLKSMQFAKELGVKEITYYGFTVDNCKRPKEQVNAFRKACIEAVEYICRDGADLLVLGKSSPAFPEELQYYSSRKPVHGGGIRVNLLVNYGWNWDISGIKENGVLRSRDISRMNLIIRWGGMRRLSGFLPVQSVYSDIYVTDTLWPDYRDEDFRAALAWYQKQDDTLGG